MGKWDVILKHVAKKINFNIFQLPLSSLSKKPKWNWDLSFKTIYKRMGLIFLIYLILNSISEHKVENNLLSLCCNSNKQLLTHFSLSICNVTLVIYHYVILGLNFIVLTWIMKSASLIFLSFYKSPNLAS